MSDGEEDREPVDHDRVGDGAAGLAVGHVAPQHGRRHDRSAGHADRVERVRAPHRLRAATSAPTTSSTSAPPMRMSSGMMTAPRHVGRDDRTRRRDLRQSGDHGSSIPSGSPASESPGRADTRRLAMLSVLLDVLDERGRPTAPCGRARAWGTRRGTRSARAAAR